MKKTIINLCAILLLGGAATTQANVIVDTGPASSSGGVGLVSTQWLAQEFTIDQAYTLTDVEGWMGATVPGTVTLAIYTYSEAIQGPVSELFSTTFSVDGRVNNWHGASNLSWELDAGTYWAAFEVRNGQTLGGYMGQGPLYSAGSFAVNQYGLGWLGGQPDGVGLRINAVPEASTYGMMLAGLVLVSVAVRRRNLTADRTFRDEVT